MADTFAARLARLNAAEQEAAKTVVFNLQLEATRPAMRLYGIDSAMDPIFWSLRVNDDLRLTVHRTGSIPLLVYGDHDDDPNEWAERRRIERHPTTGAIQLVEVRERVDEVVVGKAKGVTEPVAVASVAGSRPLESLRKAELMALGIPDAGGRDGPRDERRHADRTCLRPSAEVAEALLRLAAGEAPEPDAKIPAKGDPFTHPAAARRFDMVASGEASTPPNGAKARRGICDERRRGATIG